VLRAVNWSLPMRVLMIFFIKFVDALFTTLFEPLFTKAFDVIGESPANSCVYRGCNAD
jgi:hypothetical protein